MVAGVFQRLGYSTGLDFYSYMDLAENVVEPIMQRLLTYRFTEGRWPGSPSAT